MNLSDVVVDEMQRNRVSVPRHFLMAVGQTREPAHVHAHREVLEFWERGRNVLVFLVAVHDGLFDRRHLRRAVASGVVRLKVLVDLP